MFPNQFVKNLFFIESATNAVGDSKKITDSPALIVVMPPIVTDEANEFELSSIFHPVMVTADVPVFDNSNQSAATGLLPLDHGATSDIINVTPVGVSIKISFTNNV